MGEALRQRESFAALLLVVDIRRGVGDLDLALLDWAGRPSGQVHVLLAKADKLPRGQALTALRQAQQALDGRASTQLFSAHKGTGLEEARGLLRKWMADARKK